MLVCFGPAATEQLNSVVSEAFLSFFVKTIGHFADHFKRTGVNKQPRTFQKKSFLKAVVPKENRNFVKQFIQMQMFDLFIQEEEKHPNHEGQNPNKATSCSVYLRNITLSDTKLYCKFLSPSIL